MLRMLEIMLVLPIDGCALPPIWLFFHTTNIKYGESVVERTHAPPSPSSKYQEIFLFFVEEKKA